MAETISFPSNGSAASGFLVRPEGGSGPGVLVIQEWWGLDWGIKEMASRLALAGFVALAPDLYHGELAGHDEMDKAGALMQSMPPDRAARDMSGAIDYLSGSGGRHRQRYRCRRLLHGWNVVVPDRRRPPRQGHGCRAVLRLSAGRHGTRLVEADGSDQRAHGRPRRLLPTRGRSRVGGQSCAAWAKT